MMIYLLPALLVCCQGTLLNISDQTLILIDPLYNVNNDPSHVKVGSGLEDQADDVHNGLKNLSCIYTGPKQYSCLDFNEDLIQLVRDNTIVAINSSITLRSDIIINNITNVSIIGYDKSVEIICAFTTVIKFQNCNNISIQNITWNWCGYNIYSIYFFNYDSNFDRHLFLFNNFFGLSFKFCTNISLKSCTFNNSMVTIKSAVSGTICIDQIHFLSTTFSVTTGIIMHQDNQTEPIIIKF